MASLMGHVLVALILLVAWCAYVYFRPRKACRKCSGWGSRKKPGRKRTACGRCQATGRTMRLSAKLVEQVLHHGRGQARELRARRGR